MMSSKNEPTADPDEPSSAKEMPCAASTLIPDDPLKKKLLHVIEAEMRDGNTNLSHLIKVGLAAFKPPQ